MTQKIKPVHLNLIRLRHMLDITQEEFALKLDIGKSLLGAIECGRSQPRIELIAKSLELASIPKEHLHDFVFDYNYVLPK